MKHKNFFIVPNQIFELVLKPKELAVYFRYIGKLEPEQVA